MFTFGKKEYWMQQKGFLIAILERVLESRYKFGCNVAFHTFLILLFSMLSFLVLQNNQCIAVISKMGFEIIVRTVNKRTFKCFLSSILYCSL